jgi:selenide,water dikinase
MLPGYVAGHYDSKDIHLDLRKLCSFSGIRFLHTAAVGIVHNNEKNENGGGGGGWIICSDGRPNVRYDVLSIDVGSSPSIPADLTVHSFSSSSSALLLESSTDNTTTTTAALETNTLQGGGGGNHTVTPVKPIATFSTRWNHICQRLQQSPAGMYSPSRPFVLVVVGGGAGGIELALSVQYTLQKILRDKNARDDDALESMQVEAEAEATATATAPTVEEDNCIRIILATKGMDILPSHNKRVRDIFKRILKERNIQVKYGAEAIGVCPPTSQQSQPTHNYNDDDDDDDGTTTIPPTQQYCLKLSNESLVDHEPIYFDECLWCTSAGSSSWVKECTPFDKTEDGFFKVRDTYESVSHRGVFAAGDCCHMVDHPRPKGKSRKSPFVICICMYE